MANLSERAMAAIDALRSDVSFTSLGIAQIRHERKEAPDYGRGLDHFNEFRFNNWSWNRSAPSSINYASEVGALDESSLVMAVVNDCGIALAEATPSVRRRDPKGKWELEPEHLLAQLIERPNAFNIWADYCGALSTSYWIDGNVYFKIEPDLTGHPSELWYLPHFLVDERWPGDGKSPEVPTSGPNGATNQFLSHYQYDVPGKTPVLYRKEEIVHIKRFVNPSNPRRGIGAFVPVIREIYGDQAVAAFASTLMKNMGVIPYVLSPKEKDVTLTETQAEAIKSKFMQRTTGAHIGEPVVNGMPIDIQKLGSNLQEMDVSSLRKAFETRIAAVTRYPCSYLQFLAGLENGTSYASYAQAREQAYEQVVIPIQRTIGAQITQQLMPLFEKKPGVQFFFDTSEVRVMQEDRDALFKRESEVFRAGGTTYDEFRGAIGKEPVGGTLGEVRLVPSTSSPSTPDQLLAKADGSMVPEPVDPNLDPTALAKFADMERWFESLESQMKSFQPPSINDPKGG